jgi:hypothetical protein
LNFRLVFAWQVLSLLTEEAMASPIVRELMEGCVMRQVSLRSFVFKNRASKKDRKAAEAKAAQSAPAVKGKKGQKEAAESTSRAVSPAVADDAAAAAAAAAAAPKKHAFNEADIEELLARSSVRREPIGSDRYRRQYWKFAGDSRRCFVHDTVNQRWGFYDAPRMRALLTALNPRGIREFELRSEFERHEFALNHSGFTSTPFVPAASLASPPRSTVKSMAGQSGAVASASAALAQSLASATSEPSYLASTAAARAANFDSLFLAPRDDDKSADDLDAVPASDSPLDAHERELRRVLALAMDADGDDVSKDAAKDAAKEAGKDIQTTAKKALSRRELLALKVQRERLLKRKLGRVHLRAAMQVGSVSLTPESLSVDVLFGANVTASSPSPAPGAQPQSHGDHDYVRCPVCQEQVNPGEEFHCMLCHDTHGRDEMSARKWESHMVCFVFSLAALLIGIYHMFFSPDLLPNASHCCDLTRSSTHRTATCCGARVAQSCQGNIAGCRSGPILTFPLFLFSQSCSFFFIVFFFSCRQFPWKQSAIPTMLLVAIGSPRSSTPQSTRRCVRCCA